MRPRNKQRASPRVAWVVAEKRIQETQLHSHASFYLILEYTDTQRHKIRTPGGTLAIHMLCTLWLEVGRNWALLSRLGAHESHCVHLALFGALDENTPPN